MLHFWILDVGEVIASVRCNFVVFPHHAQQLPNHCSDCAVALNQFFNGLAKVVDNFILLLTVVASIFNGTPNTSLQPSTNTSLD